MQPSQKIYKDCGAVLISFNRIHFQTPHIMEDKSRAVDPLLPQDTQVIVLPIRTLSPLTNQSIQNGDSQGVVPSTVPKTGTSGIPRTGGGWHGFWASYGGLVMALSASIFFSAAMLIIKSMEVYGLKAFGASLLLQLGILIPSIIAILINEFGFGWRKRSRVFQGLWPINTPQKWTTVMFLWIQALLQGAAVLFRTCSLQYLSIGDMTVIVFSSPVVTTVIAHFVLKEKCGLVFIGIALFTLVGVVLITKPPILTGEQGFDSQTLIGFSIAAGALLTLSMTFVVTRKIKEEHVLLMTLTLGFVGVSLSLPLFLLFEDWDSIIPEYTESLLLTLGFLLAFLAMGSIMLALKMENAGLVALVRSCDVIFAFLLQYIFLGVEPDLLSGIGASIVWIGVLLAGSHKYWTGRKEEGSQGNDPEMEELSG